MKNEILLTTKLGNAEIVFQKFWLGKTIETTGWVSSIEVVLAYPPQDRQEDMLHQRSEAVLLILISLAQAVVHYRLRR